MSRYFRESQFDPIWRNLFTSEFLSLEYPDHKREEGESHKEYFKRSFAIYKKFRKILKSIIDLTNEQRAKKQYGFLRDFKDRFAPEFFCTEFKQITFQVECIYKNFNDQDPNQMIQDPEEEIKYFAVFKLWCLNLPNHSL